MYKILFIDDEISNNNIFEIESLHKLNHIVDRLTIKREILNKIRNNIYDFIIIDLEYGNREGDKLLLEIKKYIRLITPIIGIYGFNKSDKVKKYNVRYFNNLVTKPVLDWNTILKESTNGYIFNIKKPELFDNWLKHEKVISKYIRKKIINN